MISVVYRYFAGFWDAHKETNTTNAIKDYCRTVRIRWFRVMVDFERFVKKIVTFETSAYYYSSTSLFLVCFQNSANFGPNLLLKSVILKY